MPVIKKIAAPVVVLNQNDDGSWFAAGPGNDLVPFVMATKNPTTGVVSGFTAGGQAVALGGGGEILPPYKVGFFGDSRNNSFNGAGVEVIGSGTLLSQYRTPTWFIAHRKDTRYTQSYAFSGGAAVAWNDPARAGGRTVAAMNASDLDAVAIQYGVNDAFALTPAATTAAALQRLCIEVLKGGKACLFEAINPVTVAFPNFANVQALIDQTNDLMRAWIDSTPGRIIYSDTATLLKDASGYGNPIYYQTDGIHFSRLGAYTAGKQLAQDSLPLLPFRANAFTGSDPTAPNLLSQTPGFPGVNQFGAIGVGTGTVTPSSGRDERGTYYEWLVNITALAGGYALANLQVSANFQTSAPPAYSISNGEIYEGSAELVIDNGSGGPSPTHNEELRQRYYTGSNFNDWGGQVQAPPRDIDSILPAPLDVRAITPRLVLTANSVVANMSSSAGYQLQVIFETANLGLVRVRAYNPQLRRVGYSTTPLAVTPPATTVPYTNNSAGMQQVAVSGGTVTAIAINGVATGLIAGSFTLSRLDTITLTYSAAPLMLVKQV
jgi:lysophospholipase L1-like esterase